MTTILNPANTQQQTQQIEQNTNTQHTQTRNELTNEIRLETQRVIDENETSSTALSTQIEQSRTDVITNIISALTQLITENNENQSILESLTTVNGALDNNVTAINQHTDTQHTQTQENFTNEIQRTIDTIKSTQVFRGTFEATFYQYIDVIVPHSDRQKTSLNMRLVAETTNGINVTSRVNYEYLDDTTIRFTSANSTVNIKASWELTRHV